MRIACLLAMIVMSTALAAGAVTYYQTVRVTPDDMHGWTYAVHDAPGSNADAYFADLPGLIPPPPSSSGAFYAETGYITDPYTDLGKVHLGTNQFTGVKLRNITKLEYTTFTYMSGWDPDPSDPCSPSLCGHYVSQPFQIQLTYQQFDGNAWNWRYHMYRPFGMVAPNHLGEDQRPSNYNQWKTYDAVASGLWYDPLRANFANTWANSMFDVPGQKYYTAELRTPPTGWGYLPGSIPNMGTGTSLTLVVGAGRCIDSYFGPWWHESYLFRGFVDKFTIGIRDEVTGDITETTFDFEFGPEKIPVYATSIRALYEQIMTDACHGFKFKVAGKVTDENFDPSMGFTLEDNPGSKIYVYAPNHSLWIGAFASAVGTLRTYGSPRAIITRNTAEDVIVY